MQDLRIISLLPSATEIVFALGLGDSLVGRSHECDFPAEAEYLPICSKPNIAVDGSSEEIDRLVQDRASEALSIYDLDLALIASLHATHILTQSQCKVCAVSLEDVETALGRSGGPLRIVSLEPHKLADVAQDILRVAVACGCGERGEELAAEIDQRMGLISAKAHQALTSPRVATIEWIEPFMVAGNWIPELIQHANGQDVFGSAGQRSPYFDFQKLIEADPDKVIAFPCGFDLGRTVRELELLAKKPGWRELRAVRMEQVYCCDGHQYFNRPGPRLVESLQILGEILHPELFPPLLQGTGWLCCNAQL